MKIHLYRQNNGGVEDRTVPYESALKLPEIVYTFIGGEYRFYRKGFAANSTTYYETEALHVPE